MGRWVGFAHNIGDILTYHIRIDDTHWIIYYSAVCSTLIKHEKNLCLNSFKGEDDPGKPVKQILHTQDTDSDEYETLLFPPLKPDDLI